MRLLIIVLVVVYGVRYLFGSFGGGLGFGGGDSSFGGSSAASSRWGTGDGETYTASETPRDDYWAGSGADIGERESYTRDIPREPGDERY